MSRKTIGNDGIQVNSTKFEKNVAKTTQRSYSASSCVRNRGHERLSGGADAKSKTSVDANKPKSEENFNVISETTDDKTVVMEAEKEIEAILERSNDEDSTGDKKVDEMINYVIQNLQEAGKALASLGGENFEHDLKLMFVNIMGKVQNWVSLAQIRIDAARNDLKNLRLELLSRMKEIAAREEEITEVKKKLAESEAAISNYEKSLAESAQKSAAPLATPTMSYVPPQPMPTGVASAPLEELAVDSQHLSGHEEIRQGATSTANLQDQQEIASEKQRSARMEVPATADVAVQYGKGKERRRESELESELARLRKENERIAKERADYENAIQRALLRGVSSLNAETLKVLRCPPPVSCYTPCGPPPSPVNTVSPVVCKRSPTASLRRCSKMRVDENPPKEERVCCGAKRPTTTSYTSSSRYRKLSGSCSRSTAPIIEQAATSTAACVAPCNKSKTRSWSRSKSKKIEASTCTKKLE